MARDCRQPKRIQHQPVPEKRANLASKEVPHEQLTWTACYDDDCFTHQESKNETGWYPKAPKKTKTLAMAKKEEIPTKYICMMRKEYGNKKFIRKVKEQLEDLSREDRIEVIKRPELDFKEIEGRIDFRLNNEEPQAGSSSFVFGKDSPYDSDEFYEVTRRHTQTEISQGSCPSIDDTSSEEDSDEPRYRNIDPLDDEQTLQFYGTGEPKEVSMTRPTKKDHSLLDVKDVFHKELFWAECLDDKCLWHLSPKKDSHFYPRRRDNRPIKDVYVDDQLPNWMLMYFDGTDRATFGPDPSFPMSCQHNKDMDWHECRHDQCQIHYIYKAQAWRERQEQIEQEDRLRRRMSKN
ncbi:hypothetical protein CFIO01_13748 [Colletotrichum fioriniae PJ7]|uniref:Uncharacterized protein n=1 Tax=Colletotrichum fioriniae PJ7 TaxID=1445577 RepID=A0A010SN04_9PEZI|nr:hypothetical protein CFIO01_13748 [Colletotrichum fioriniae PJ7]